jgi:hypothetical protein
LVLVAAMVASALFIMDLKGKIIISRNYRGDIPMTVADKFARRLCVLDPLLLTLPFCPSCSPCPPPSSYFPAFLATSCIVHYFLIFSYIFPTPSPRAAFLFSFSAEEDATALVPVMIDDGVTFAFIKHNNLYRACHYIVYRSCHHSQ